MQSEADGDAHADGVVTYVEVWARPDNDVSKKHLRDAGAFCGRTIYTRERTL